MLGEMHGIISFFEDLKRSGKADLEPHFDTMQTFAKRLSDMTDKNKTEKDSNT